MIQAVGEADLATKRDLKDTELRLEARIDKFDTGRGGELMQYEMAVGCYYCGWGYAMVC